MPFYVLSAKVIGGRGRSKHATVWIQTEPGRTNLWHTPRTKGWLGATNNIDYNAHGEYPTLEAAKKAIAKIWSKGKTFSVEG